MSIVLQATLGVEWILTDEKPAQSFKAFGERCRLSSKCFVTDLFQHHRNYYSAAEYMAYERDARAFIAARNRRILSSSHNLA